ncbi:hypothetical protein GCM10012279_35380 [Micromonospora yangpuensis]|nr:hypothetical protein GCM10012279_35380 [Micromonospora yangpuensis]
MTALTLLACGGGSSDDQAEPAAAPPADRTSAPAPSASTWSTAQRAYLDALAEIDPGLVANEERAIRRAETTCGDIEAEGLSETALTKRVVERLSGGNATIDTAQAKKALALMREHIC